MADPKTTNRFVSTDSKFDFYANVISHAELYANNISANSFNVGSQTLEEYIQIVGGGGGSGDVTNNYVTATFVSNNYLEDIKSTFGTGDVTNNYLTATFSSNNYVQDILDTKATNTYVNSTFSSNNYIQDQLDLKATNTYVNSTFTSNNYVDGRFSSNTYVTSKIGLRATNTYVNDTFSSNNYLQDQLDLKATNTYVNSTFTSNNYVEGRFVSNTYVTTRLGIRATNTYVQETFTSNNYVQDVLDTKATNTYVNSTFTSNNYVDGRFTSNSFVKDTFTSNNYVQTQLDLKATNTYVNSTFTSNNYVDGRFTSNNYVESQLSNKVSTTHAGDVSITGNVTITSTEDGSSAGPDLILYRNSASPNDGDYIGQIQFKGRQDGPGDEIYAKVTGKISDSTNSTEDGLIETAIKGNGTFTIVSRQKSNELQLLNGVGLSVDGSIAVGGTVDGRDIASDGSTLDSISSTYASNNYLVTTFASNNYLQDRLTAFGNGDVTNNYLVATFTSNNYVQTQLGLKLNSSSYTAADVLTKIKTVDGAGSGLDADTLDGLQGSSYSSNNYITNHYTSNNYIQTFVAAEVAGIVDSAPAALDTLNELAAALGDDANFSTTVSNQIGLRATNTYVNSTFSSNNYLQGQLSTKLNSSSYTASDVLTKIKTVDGSGSGLDADTLDGQHGSYYLNTSTSFGGDVSGTYNNIVVTDDSHSHSNYLINNGNATTTGYLQAEGFVGSGGTGTHILAPHGAHYATNASTVTGAIKVTLPQSWTNTMLRFTVKVYEYASGESFDIVCAGYNYNPSTTWINTSAYILGDPTVSRNFNVRFGHDGSKCCVYIGETSSTWSYPQVMVSEFYAGYSNYSIEDWNDNWDISFATSFGTITRTESNNEIGRYVDNNIVWHAGNDGSGSGLDADLLDGIHATGLVSNNYFQDNSGGGGGATGGGSDKIFYNNDQTVTTSYTIPSGQNSMTAGPISINSGVTVTVPSGSEWTIV